MALLTAGYFPANYFPNRYWQTDNQYWLEYGTGTVGGDSARYYYMRKPPKKDKKRLLIQVKNLLTALKGE